MLRIKKKKSFLHVCLHSLNLLWARIRIWSRNRKSRIRMYISLIFLSSITPYWLLLKMPLFLVFSVSFTHVIGQGYSDYATSLESHLTTGYSASIRPDYLVDVELELGLLHITDLVSIANLPTINLKYSTRRLKMFHVKRSLI